MVKAQVRELTRRMDAELAALAWRNQLRTLGTIHGVNLSSNDYLGLATDPRLLEAVTSALVAGSAVGSTGSRLLSGNAEIWEELESEVAQFMGSEAALYFNSGYSANVGLLSAVIRPSDVVFSDAANHASILDTPVLLAADRFPNTSLVAKASMFRVPVIRRLLIAWSAIPAGAIVGGWVIKATGNVALVYGVIGIIVICIAAFFRFFTALGDAQRYVDERRAEEERISVEPLTA